MSDARWQDKLFAALQQTWPTRALSQLMHHLTRIEWPAFKNAHIKLFMQGFNISLAEAEYPRAEDYPTFNAFFTRALKPGARPLDRDATAMISPVDGTVSQAGPIRDGRIVQAKGIDYSAEELLGGDATAFKNGNFTTIYLAPYNYHRIHMPVTGSLREWSLVPGQLFSVSPGTVRALPRVFSRNERLCAIFDTPRGPIAMVLVGALFVGGIETVWSGAVTPPHTDQGGHYQTASPVSLERGVEMGRFNMGSTVILLTPPGFVEWDARLQPGTTLRMGERIGRLP